MFLGKLAFSGEYAPSQTRIASCFLGLTYSTFLEIRPVRDFAKSKRLEGNFRRNEIFFVPGVDRRRDRPL